jgi:hypothetical protein
MNMIKKMNILSIVKAFIKLQKEYHKLQRKRKNYSKAAIVIV